jgi:WD40 repeat protein
VVKVHDAETGAVLASLETGTVNQVAFSADGLHLATASKDQSIRVWDTTKWQEEFALKGHGADVRAVAFHPHGRRLASLGGDGTIRIWQVPAVQEKSVRTARTSLYHSSALSPDGKRYAWTNIASGADRGIHIYDALTGLEIAHCMGHRGGPVVLAFGPDGRLLASGGGPAKGGGQGQAFVWDAATGRRLCDLKEHPDTVQQVDFIADGQRLLTVDARGVARIWDVPHGRCVASWTLPLRTPRAVVLAPDGQRLACASRSIGQRSILILEVATGKQLFSMQRPPPQLPGAPLAMTFSPDGRYLAFTEGALQIFETEKGTAVLSFGGQDESVTALTFAPDGSRLATARPGKSYPGQVQIWETRTGQELLSLKTLAGSPRGLTFSEQGRRLDLLTANGPSISVVSWHTAPLPRQQVVQRDAWELVKALFHKHLLRADVIEALRGEASLTGALEKAALELAQKYPADPERLNNTAWLLVRSPGGSAESYRRAVLLAEEACRLVPNQGFYLNTLGVAQYRAGDFAVARDTLLRAEPLNARRYHKPIPHDLAFLAMARHRLGETDQARADLERLRQAVTQPPWTGNQEASAFLHEAEQLLKGP